MAKDKKSKKIISTNSGKKVSSGNVVDTGSVKKKLVSQAERSSSNLGEISSRAGRGAVAQDLLFGRQNYLFIGVAFGLIILGMLLMMGGNMPDSNTWDESLIYSTRRTLIAPIVILIGLVVGVFAIFRD